MFLHANKSAREPRRPSWCFKQDLERLSGHRQLSLGRTMCSFRRLEADIWQKRPGSALCVKAVESCNISHGIWASLGTALQPRHSTYCQSANNPHHLYCNLNNPLFYPNGEIEKPCGGELNVKAMYCGPNHRARVRTIPAGSS